MDNLRITLLQTDLHWESPTANRAMLEEKIAQIEPKSTDIIVLPELFTTAFTMNIEPFAELPKASTHKWLAQMAAQTDAVVVGSYAVKEAGNLYNRMLWMQPDGEFQSYDKAHLFRMGGEEKVFKKGNKKSIIKYKNWNIALFVCYDVRFPVWSRNRNLEYDLAIYVASWASARREVWRTLLQARAIENQCYVVGVNRVGIDGNNYHHGGDSALIDFKGKKCVELIENEAIHTETISKTDLEQFRTKFPTYLDADAFTIL